jgi:hypothetical protein
MMPDQASFRRAPIEADLGGGLCTSGAERLAEDVVVADFGEFVLGRGSRRRV